MKNNNHESHSLKVSEAKQRDVGKARARIGRKKMISLGLKSGDIIEIKGKRTTAATIWQSDSNNEDSESIRIDGQTRKNAKVVIDDYVQIKKIDPLNAKTITISPIGTKLKIDNDFSDFIKSRMKSMPIVKEDIINIIILGNSIQFKIIKSAPSKITKIEKNTKLKITSESLNEKEISPHVTWEEIGGLNDEVRKLREIVEIPLRHPEIFTKLGIDPPKGILLYGPPGCGKTLLARGIAAESEAFFYSISGPEIMSKYYGETESKLREIFREAKNNAPSIIFLDEIDAIAPKREEVFGDVEKRVVAQLLAIMDGLSDRGNVVIIGATNRPESIDPALRRPGRFDREIEIGVPNKDDRHEILLIHTRGMPLAKDVNLKNMSEELHGFTGADLRAHVREAALQSLRRNLPQMDLEKEHISAELLESLEVENLDFKMAKKLIIPSALREFYIENATTSWETVGGMEKIKNAIEENIIWSIKEPEKFTKLGIDPPKGILLYGPPGCGKTLLARATANKSEANFITIKGPEILSKWVGESELAIREIFRKAKSATPCIILIDEIDSITKARSFEDNSFNSTEKVLSQLLTEMDSSENSQDVFVIGTTNRPDLLDMSLMRPGRFDHLLYLGPPDEKSRISILKILKNKMPIQKISIEELALLTKGYSGADLKSLCRQAAISAMKNNTKILKNDFTNALKIVTPSIDQKVEEWYKNLQNDINKALPKNMEKTFYN